MYNIKAKDIGERLNNCSGWVVNNTVSERRIQELWAIMSDMQLWMSDYEEKERISNETSSIRS